MKREDFDKHIKPIMEYKKSCEKIEDIQTVINSIKDVPDCKLIFSVGSKNFEVVNFGVGLVSDDSKKEFWASFIRSLEKVIDQEEKKKEIL